MEWSPISKSRDALQRTPNLADYPRRIATSAGTRSARSSTACPGGGTATSRTRRCSGTSRDRPPIESQSASLPRAPRRGDCTYRELAADARRFANVLVQLGVQRGERVASVDGSRAAALCHGPRHVGGGRDLLSAVLGIRPEPVKSRLVLGSARVLVTTDCSTVARSRRSRRGARVAPRAGRAHAGCGRPAGGHARFRGTRPQRCVRFRTASTAAEDYALLHFTSGTTGQPKGVLHAHAAVTAHLATARWVLDLQEDDVYWCTADPGWVTGIRTA